MPGRSTAPRCRCLAQVLPPALARARPLRACSSRRRPGHRARGCATAGRHVQAMRCTCRRTRRRDARGRTLDQALAQEAREQVRPEHVGRNVSSSPSSVRAARRAARPRCGRGRATGSPVASRRRRTRDRAAREMSTSSRHVLVARSATIPRRASSPFAASRTSRRSDAPRRARPVLAASPRPPPAPVTTHTRPSIRGGSAHPRGVRAPAGRRARTSHHGRHPARYRPTRRACRGSSWSTIPAPGS